MRVLAVVLLALLPWAPLDLWLGNRAYDRGDYAEAAARYRRALQADPASAAARLNLGDALYRQGRFAEAASEFTRAGESPDPGLRARAAYNLGNALFRQEDWAGAAEAYMAALRWDEDDDDARHNLQEALDRMRQGSSSAPEARSGEPKPEDRSGGKAGPRGQDRKEQPQAQASPKAAGAGSNLDREDAGRVLRYFEGREREDRPAPRFGAQNMRRSERQRLRPPRGAETW